MRTPPDIAQWRDLYTAARLFREAAPWETLSEDQLFAVDSPAIGETLYCSILGASDGQEGLIAARGARGLIGYVMLTANELDEDEGALEQDGLSYLQGAGSRVTDDDRDVHAKLGLEFADEGEMPLFLSLKPHYVAQRPDADEARALTIALDHARALVEELRAGVEQPDAVEGEQIIGRQQGDDGAWSTVVLALPSPPAPIRLEVEQVRCAAVLRFGRRSREVWEVTTAALGTVDPPDDGPSFWGRMLVCVDKDSKALLDGELIGPEEGPQNALLSAIERGGTIPRYLDLSSGLLHSQLQPLADVLKIRMRLLDNVPLANQMRQAVKAALAEG